MTCRFIFRPRLGVGWLAVSLFLLALVDVSAATNPPT